MDPSGLRAADPFGGNLMTAQATVILPRGNEEAHRISFKPIDYSNWSNLETARPRSSCVRIQEAGLQLEKGADSEILSA